jgi:hypothetical protein
MPGDYRRFTGIQQTSAFYGITIWMYWDEGQHARPHFHARYAGDAASVAFDGTLIAGTLPPRALGMLRAQWTIRPRWASDF